MGRKLSSDYKHNAKMSLKNLGVDVGNTYFDKPIGTANEMKSVMKDVRATFKGSNTKMDKNSLIKKVSEIPLVKVSSDMVKEAFKRLKSGKFYDSEEEAFGLGGDFDFDFDFGDSFFDDGGSSSYSSSDEQQGQSTDTASESIQQSKTIEIASKVAKSSSGAISKASLASSQMILEGLAETARTINATIGIASADIKNSVNEGFGIVKNMSMLNKGILEQSQKMVTLQTDILSELKQLREMSADYMIPKINGKEEDEDEERGVQDWYKHLKKGKSVDGVKELLKNIGRTLDSASAQGIFSQISTAMPLIMMTTGGNPFALLKIFGLEPLLDSKFGLADLKKRIDDRIKDVPDTIDKIARTASLSDNNIIRAIGDGLRTQRNMTSTIRTDRYEKGRVFFDGKTKEAIVNVIPTYLSSIVSLLSGNERTAYDYDKGMFRTLSYLKSDFFSKMPKLEFEYDRLASIIKDNLAAGDEEGLDPKRLKQISQVLMERLAQSNYTISNFKEMKYDKALDVLKLRDTELTESDFLKLRGALAQAETNESTRARFAALDNAGARYLSDRNRFMAQSSKTARDNGLIATLNNSLALDSGSYGISRLGTLGTALNPDGAPVAPVDVPKPREYKHLLDGWGDVTVEDSSKIGNIFGRTLSEEQIDTINEHQNKVFGGLGVFKGNANATMKILLQSRLLAKLGIKDEAWYKRMVNNSDFNVEDILANKEFLDNLVNQSVAEEELKNRLDGLGINDEGQEKILDIITDPDSSQDDIRKSLEDEINKSTSLGGIKSSLTEEFKTKGESTLESLKEKKDDYVEKAKSMYDTASERLSDALGGYSEKAKDFYSKNKETIGNVAKASVGAGAGLLFLKALRTTGIGSMFNAFGLLSPIAIGAGALGAGIYAYKNNIFDRLFGDENKVSKTMKYSTNVVKTALLGAGSIAGLSTLLTPITGGAFGLMGPTALALSGLALGIAGETKTFKKLMFGTEEGSFMHNMKLWLFGDKEIGKRGMLTGVGERIANFFDNSNKKVQLWFQKDIWKPLSQTFKPIGNFINTTANKLYEGITGIPAKIEESFIMNFKTNLAVPLMQKFEEHLIRPLSSFFKKATGGLGRLLGGIISAPFKFFRTLITGKTDSDVFAGSFGSSSGERSAEYKSNMREKEKLYNDTKYQSLGEALDGRSKREQKQIKKFKAQEELEKRAEERGEEEVVEVQQAKSLSERLAEYKKRKATETPKGISEDYYFNQYTMKTPIENFNISYGGCGLSCLATVISTITGSKIEPHELMSEKFGWDYQAYGTGIPMIFMSNVLSSFFISSRVVKDISYPDLEKHIDNGGYAILSIDDFDTDQAHYILVHDYDEENFIFSDPARSANEKKSKDLVIAKTYKVLLVYKRGKINSLLGRWLSPAGENQVRPRSLYASIVGEEEVKEKIVEDVVEEIKADIKETEEVQQAKPVEDIKEAEEVKVTEEIKEEPVKAKKKRTFGDFVQDLGAEAKAERKAFLKEAKEGSLIKALITAQTTIHKTLKEFRSDNNDNLNMLADKLEVQTNGVAYNLEYIKRLLTKVHQTEVEGFSEKDIGKTGMGRMMAWVKGKFRKAKNIIMKPFEIVSRVFTSIGTKIDNMVNFVTTFPQRMIAKVHKLITSILPSKETIMAWGNMAKTLAINLYKGTKKLISDTYSGIKSFLKSTKDQVTSFIKSSYEGIKNATKYVLDKTAKGLRWGFSKMMEGLSFLGGKTWDGIKWVGRKGAQGISWLADKIKGTSNTIKGILAPREVFVTGGTLNTVQKVEVVKSVGAVDLEYAESISRKIPEKSTKKAVQEMRENKTPAPSVLQLDYKPPKFKTGQEYALIDARQDAEKTVENNVQQSTALVPVEQSDKGGMVTGLLSMFGGKGFKGLLGKFSGAIVSKVGPLVAGVMSSQGIALAKMIGGGLISALGSYGLYKVMDGEVGDKYEDMVDNAGYDGEWNRDHVKGQIVRNGVKGVITNTSKAIVKLGLFKGAREAAEKAAKNMINKLFKGVDVAKATKTIASKLRALFKHPKVVKVLGKNITSKFTKAIPKLATKAAKSATKMATLAGAKMAAYGLPPVGLIVDIVFIVYDLVSGMTWDADNLFGVKSQWDLTMNQRFVAGTVKMLQGFLASKGPLILLSLIPTDWLVQTLYECIADEDEFAKWQKKHKEFEEETAKLEAEKEQMEEADTEVQEAIPINNSDSPEVKQSKIYDNYLAKDKVEESQAQKFAREMAEEYNRTHTTPLPTESVDEVRARLLEQEKREKEEKKDKVKKVDESKPYASFLNRKKHKSKLKRNKALSDSEANKLTGAGEMDEDARESGFIDLIYSIISSSNKEEEQKFVDDDGNEIEFTDYERESQSRPLPKISDNDRNLKRLSNPDYRDKIEKMYQYAKNKYGADLARNFLRISYAESQWKQDAFNKNTKAEGLFQVVPTHKKAWGFEPHESPSSFDPIDQFKRVAPNLLRNSRRNGAQPTLTNMYAALHYPVAVGQDPNWVLYGKNKDPKAYKYNTGVDYNKDGNVTVSELGEFVGRHGATADAYAKKLAFSGYGPMEMVSQKSSSFNALSMGPAMSFKDAGCGPAVMAMLLQKLGIKYNMESLVAKARSMKQTMFGGTPMTYFKEVLKDVGIGSAIFNKNITEKLINELDAGRSPILLTVASNGNPHYIIGKELDGDRIVINDPEKTSSETITINDRRITKAKAILVYSVPSSMSDIPAEVNGTGYGLFDAKSIFRDLSKEIKGTTNGAIKNLERGASNSIKKHIKSDFVGSIANDIISKNSKSLNGAINNLTSPITKGLSTLDGAQRKIYGDINKVTRTAENLTRLPEKLIKNASDRTINAIFREVNGATRQGRQLISDVLDIGKLIKGGTEEVKNFTMPSFSKKENSPQNVQQTGGMSSQLAEKLVREVGDIKTLLSKLIDVVAKGNQTVTTAVKDVVINNNNNPKQLTVNKKKVYTTVGGTPQPYYADSNSSEREWFEQVEKIARG